MFNLEDPPPMKFPLNFLQPLLRRVTATRGGGRGGIVHFVHPRCTRWGRRHNARWPQIVPHQLPARVIHTPETAGGGGKRVRRSGRHRGFFYYFLTFSHFNYTEIALIINRRWPAPRSGYYMVAVRKVWVGGTCHSVFFANFFLHTLIALRSDDGDDADDTEVAGWGGERNAESLLRGCCETTDEQCWLGS